MFVIEAEVAQALKQPRSDFLYFGPTFTFLYVGVCILTHRLNCLGGQTINIYRVLKWKGDFACDIEGEFQSGTGRGPVYNFVIKFQYLEYIRVHIGLCKGGGAWVGKIRQVGCSMSFS